MRYLLPILFVVSMMAAVPQAGATSFNCNYAKLPSEVAICQDGTLSQLDEIMANKYFTLKRRVPYAVWRQISRTQRQWLRGRNSCGYNFGCIDSSYRNRIGQLNYWLSVY